MQRFFEVLVPVDLPLLCKLTAVTGYLSTLDPTKVLQSTEFITLKYPGTILLLQFAGILVECTSKWKGRKVNIERYFEVHVLCRKVEERYLGSKVP